MERARAQAFEIARLIEEKRGEEIVVLDMEELITIVKYFVIATAKNKKQARTIEESVRMRGKELGWELWGSNGDEEAHWTLMDYGEVVVHIFLEPWREYYNLEMLWGDAPYLEWQGGLGGGD